ncbi:phage tail assembly chaperone [Pseudomonas gingeri]|uniref:Phage tail protein n=1 Tax=Pseudomonas gingeri TaxID=117681 RepID=A0A7Y8CJ88_9PSED|nr:phage tail assembly chaperone [Pseudomonas gingeri]NWB31616.1 hypothetical protein [Pseudomonas gingeri]NWC33108.1 hypothetical protein [Pseudomonas gingeri]
MMRALVKNNVVVALVSGDVDCGESLEVGSLVECGWTFLGGQFYPVSKPSEDDKKTALAETERLWRDTQLGQTQWLVARSRDEIDLGLNAALSVDQLRDVQVYRQSLRDWPASPLFPEMTERPVIPEWLIKYLR